MCNITKNNRIIYCGLQWVNLWGWVYLSSVFLALLNLDTETGLRGVTLLYVTRESPEKHAERNQWFLSGLLLLARRLRSF